MDDSQQWEKVPPSIRFIPDEPADADFFSTHTRLAEAIVTAVEANAEVKVVGLLGRWGSGNATAEEWGRAISSGHEPYGFSRRVAEDDGLQFDAKSQLYEALNKAVATIVGPTDREVRDRWFTLLDLMKPKQARALQQTLGAALDKAAPEQVLKILMIGGRQFLKSAGFAAAPEQAIQTVIISQLDRKDGREWLRENRDELAGWIARAGSAARVELKAALRNLGSSKLEERRYTAGYLLNRWNLD